MSVLKTGQSDITAEQFIKVRIMKNKTKLAVV